MCNKWAKILTIHLESMRLIGLMQPNQDQKLQIEQVALGKELYNGAQLQKSKSRTLES